MEALLLAKAPEGFNVVLWLAGRVISVKTEGDPPLTPGTVIPGNPRATGPLIPVIVNPISGGILLEEVGVMVACAEILLGALGLVIGKDIEGCDRMRVLAELGGDESVLEKSDPVVEEGLL